MSFLVRPKIEAERIPGVTLMAAVVVCNSIEQVCDVKCTIKWPNDILLSARKVAGVLSEASWTGDKQFPMLFIMLFIIILN